MNHNTLCSDINSPLVMDLHKWLGLLCEQTNAFDTEKEKSILSDRNEYECSLKESSQ